MRKKRHKKSDPYIIDTIRVRGCEDEVTKEERKYKSCTRADLQRGTRENYVFNLTWLFYGFCLHSLF